MSSYVKSGLFMKKYYAAYLCCASDDLLHFGLPFHEMLEKWGFRIFIAERDLLVGDRYYDSMAEYLEERSEFTRKKERMNMTNFIVI